MINIIFNSKIPMSFVKRHGYFHIRSEGLMRRNSTTPWTEPSEPPKTGLLHIIRIICITQQITFSLWQN